MCPYMHAYARFSRLVHFIDIYSIQTECFPMIGSTPVSLQFKCQSEETIQSAIISIGYRDECVTGGTHTPSCGRCLTFVENWCSVSTSAMPTCIGETECNMEVFPYQFGNSCMHKSSNFVTVFYQCYNGKLLLPTL